MLKKAAGKMKRVTFFMTFMEYFPFPGWYRYPFGNGQYEIYPDPHSGRAMISVTTRGGGHYTHPVSSYIGYTAKIEVGWCSVMYSACSDPWNRIVPVYLPRVRFSGYSILSNWSVSRGK